MFGGFHAFGDDRTAKGPASPMTPRRWPDPRIDQHVADEGLVDLEGSGPAGV